MTMNNQRLYFTALLCGMAVLGVQAQKVSEEQALQRAKAFLSKKTASVLTGMKRADTKERPYRARLCNHAYPGRCPGLTAHCPFRA